MMFSQYPNTHRIFKRLAKGSDQTARMRRLFWAIADRTYQIVRNLMPQLKRKTNGNKILFFELNNINIQWLI